MSDKHTAVTQGQIPLTLNLLPELVFFKIDKAPVGGTIPPSIFQAPNLELMYAPCLISF